MISLFARTRTILARLGLPAAVFVGGVLASAYLYVATVQHSQEEQLADLQESARYYEALLRHRLGQYMDATRSMGAFFSASGRVDPEEFEKYMAASRLFERLEGSSSFGYLPRVEASQLQRFEAETAQTFAGFRISSPRYGADAFYPLLYGQHATDANRADRLRGFDFSSVPERWQAMREADMRDAPVASSRHSALQHAGRAQVVMLFTPVRGARAGTNAKPGADLKGFVFSSMYVDRLFQGFDHGRLAQLFDLEVFEDRVAESTVLFDADQVPHVLQPESAHVLAHRVELQFANRNWLIFFYAKKAVLNPKATQAGAQMFAIGLLLSLVASYVAAAWPRYLVRKRARRDFSERFAGFFEGHPFAVYALDTERRIIHANQQLARELGVSREALVGASVDSFIVDESRAVAARRFEEVLAGNAVAYTSRVVAPDGRRSDMSIVLIPMSAGGTLTHVLGFAENITERKQAELALHESRQMLRHIIDNIPQSVFWKDLDSVFLGGNRSLLEDAGLDNVDELVGKTDADLRWKDQAEHFRQVDRDVMRSGLPRLKMQATDHRRDGSPCWIETSKIPLKDEQGKVVGVLAVTEDITARKYMEQELFRRANYDILTGLPNRGFFDSHLGEAVKRAQRQPGLALMYFDIDRFKHINDNYGHDVGDEVIRMFASRTRAVLRESDFIARLGGDEFVLVIEGLAEREDAAVIAEKLVLAMVPPFLLPGAQLQVSTSIGVAYYEAGMAAETLVKAADQAMYQAKRAGRNCFRQAEAQRA
ncbi:diguanylate cyclase domain-containing protein [Pseudoduganella sp. R-34]|uniref:sensor domain-containing diguanylate cyclase n=1 Tax=Pseudoduganella sp. R-34 TaxID=3404062 RepID=UPI003CE80B59